MLESLQYFQLHHTNLLFTNTPPYLHYHSSILLPYIESLPSNTAMATATFNSNGFTAVTEKKSAKTVTIEEIQVLEDPIICKMPVSEPIVEKMEMKFKCEYPAPHPKVTRVLQPLPFPEKLEDVIAWTDAFVDRIATLTAKEKKVRNRHLIAAFVAQQGLIIAQKNFDEKTDLKAQINGLKTTNSSLRKNLEEAIKIAIEQSTAAKNLKADLERTEAESRGRFLKIGDLTSQLSEANAQIAGLKKENNVLRTVNKVQEKALADAKIHTDVDHEELEKEHNLYEKERAAKDTAQKKLVQVEGELAKEKQEVACLKKDLKCTEKALEDSKTANAELQKNLNEEKAKREAAEKSLEAATKSIADLTDELKSAQGKIAEAEKNLKAAKQNVTDLENEKTVISKDRDTAKADLEKTRAELTTAKNTINDQISSLIHANKEKEDAETALANERTKQSTQIKGFNSTIAHLQGELALHKDHDEAGFADLKSKLVAAQIELESLKKLAITRSGKGITLLSVEYGGKDYTGNKTITDKMYTGAVNGKAFKINNDFFIKDPMPKFRKSFSIAYLVDGTSTVVHLHGWEHAEVNLKAQSVKHLAGWEVK